MVTVTIKFMPTTDSRKIQEQVIRYLLMDALGEFQVHRQPIREYVAKRYSWMSQAQKDEKVEQVLSRCFLASDMHNAVIDVQINDEELYLDE